MLLNRPRAAGAALLVVLAAAPVAALVPRVEKAHLAFDPVPVAAGPGSDARFTAVVTIDAGWHAQAHVPTYDYLIPTVLGFDLPPGFGEAAVDYPKPTLYKFEFADEQLAVYEGTVALDVRLPVPAGTSGTLEIPAHLRYQACNDRQCLPPVDATATVKLVVGAGGGAAAAAPDASPPDTESAPHTATIVPAGPATPLAPSRRSLAGVLLLALLGGLILNAMPCVLPILSLKVFSLVKASGQRRGAVRAGALATAAGILLSFAGLATAAIAARRAGAAIGWGVQFQQPGFVAFLAVVILLFSLNLWGLFEIPLPSRLARWADAGASGEGLPGHFASGLFATLMATPCSAPFLGTALSFALAQRAGIVVATLMAVGVGLALPYLALAVAPGVVRWLPRPGAWMDTLRGVMGFLLAGALVWLLYVLGAQIAAEALAFFELALLGLGLAVWLAARSRPASVRRTIAWALVLVVGAGAVGLAARSPRPRPAAMGGAAAPSGALAWVAYDPARAQELVRSGQPVFLDISADWCVTCKVNERVILGNPEVVAAFRRNHVVAMRADWTNRSDEIARFLAAHGRYGIPFYMLYRPGQQPHLFGELISRQEVIDTLDAASAAAAASSTPPSPPAS